MPTHFTHTSGHILPIDDGRLYVELAGNPDGPTLVLLHGGLGDLTDFNGLLDLLPAQFRFLGIDLRGHGRSTLGNGSLTYQRHQADVEAVLTHLGVDAYSVLGFSDGGITAYRREHPILMRQGRPIQIGIKCYKNSILKRKIL